MSNQTGKPEHQNGNGSYERQDLRVSGILYFLLTLIVVTAFCMFALRGIYSILEHRARVSETPVNPLVKDIPEDTRHVAHGYPQDAFPDPRLEEDERGQLDNTRTKEEQELYSYGWVDQKAGTVRIPIERAMDLLVQRGLPVRAQAGVGEAPTPRQESKQATENQDHLKHKNKQK